MLNGRSLLGGVLLGYLVAAVGCTDEVPTAADDRFDLPEREIETIEVELEGEEFFEPLARFGSFVEMHRFGTGLVASSFDGVLDARTLLRTGELSDTVTYVPQDEDGEDGEAVTDSVFETLGATITASVRVTASTADDLVRLSIRTIAEEWDPQTATWEMAVDTTEDRREWATPGGSFGAELAATSWESEGELFTDSLTWELDAAAANRLFDQEESHGVAFVAEGAQARLELTDFTLQVRLRPESHPDTVLTRSVSTGRFRSIFTPEMEPVPPADQGPDDPLSVGGVFGHRVYFQLVLPDSVPACPEARGGAAACGRVPLSEVTINRARLLLNPVREPRDGFRALAPVDIRILEIAEPERGRQAILGRGILDPGGPGVEVASDGSPAVRIDSRASVVRIDLTSWLRSEIALATSREEDDEEALEWTLGFIGAPEGGDFGIVRLSPDTRFRILYTVLPEFTAP